MEIFLILLSLALIMYLAYKGFSVVLLAPVCALLAASVSGMAPLPTFTELLMIKAAGYFKSFLPIFLLGALFGKLMGDGGLTTSIAKAIMRGVGRKQAVLAVSLAALFLSYGGVSLFVAAFAIYPFGSALFKEAGVPKRLLPGSIALGLFGASMGYFPGTPQIQNVIPSVFFGTDTFAAPGIGMVSGIACFASGLAWLEWRRRNAARAGEGYGNHTLNEIPEEASAHPVAWPLAVTPILAVLILNYVFTKRVEWDASVLDVFKDMGLPFLAKSIASVRSSWALIIALLAGIVLTIIVGWRNFGGIPKFIKSLNSGAAGAVTAILNTALLVGYGSVLSSLAGFKVISNALMSIKIGNSPLLSEYLIVSLMGGVTGSASGGVSIALQVMGKEWLDWANAIGMSPDILHRIAAIASGGLSSMPHNGAVVTLIVLCGLTHKESYGDIFAICIGKLITGFFAIMLFNMFGLF